MGEDLNATGITIRTNRGDNLLWEKFIEKLVGFRKLSHVLSISFVVIWNFGLLLCCWTFDKLSSKGKSIFVSLRI